MIANHGKLEAFLHKSSHNACLNLEQRNHERILANTSIVAEIMLLDDLKPFHSLKALEQVVKIQMIVENLCFSV